VDNAKRTVVITGASGGIGKATATELAGQGHTVVPVVRDCEKSLIAIDDIAASCGQSVNPVFADLSSRQSVLAAADEIRQSYGRIDVLVNNAGVYKRRCELSADGIEMTLAVNFAAPFLLTNELIPLMERGSDSRIVNLTSELYRNGRLVLDLDSRDKYSGKKAYADSKLLVAVWTRELARRVEGLGITANCVHPGVVGTDAFRDYPGWVNTILNMFISKPEEGAKPVVRLAVDPQLAGATGGYYYMDEPRDFAGAASDSRDGARVWDFGVQLTTFQEGQAPSSRAVKAGGANKRFEQNAAR